MFRVVWSLALVIVAMAIGPVAGQEARKAPAQRETRAVATRPASPDEAAIQGVDDAFTKAFNAGDAKAIAAMHTPDAQMIDVAGTLIEGRKAIEEEYAHLFRENPGVTIEVRPDSVRRLGTDAAIEDGHTRLVPKQAGAPVINHYAAVYVKQGGKWLLANVREMPGEDPSPHDRLKELEWLLGDWVDEAGDSVILSNVQWSTDKNYLIRDFSIQAKGETALTGTQRIGWNPGNKQIKSWVFDSEGGHGEELWARLGDHWVVKASGVLQDGRTTTATHTISREGKDACRWRTADRTVGADVVPVVDEFVMVRRPPSPRTK